MAISVTSVINKCTARYRDLVRSDALSYMQMVHDKLSAEIRMSYAVNDAPLVAQVPSYVVPGNVLRVWRAELRTDGLDGFRLLEQQSARMLDFRPRHGCGSPVTVSSDRSPSGGRVLILSPAPSLSSLVVSGGTPTTPIVISFTANHNLSTGSQIYLTGIAGLGVANGLWPTVSVISPTQVSLDGSVGTGAYTSGGIGATAFLPFLRSYATVQQVLADDNNVTVLPDCVFDDRAYFAGVLLRHAEARHTEDLQMWIRLFQVEKTNLETFVTRTLADVRPTIQPGIQRIYGATR